MKKILLLIAIVSVSFAFLSCESTGSVEDEKGKLDTAKSIVTDNYETLWVYSTGYNLVSVNKVCQGALIAFAGEYLEFGSPNHVILSLDPQSGALNWKTDVGEGLIIVQHSIQEEGMILTDMNEAKHYLSVENGEKIEKITAAEDAQGKFAQTAGQVGISIEGKTIKGINSPSNSVLWEKEEDSLIVKSAAALGKVFYVKESQRKVFCVDAQSGEPLFSIDVPAMENVKNPDNIDFSIVAYENKLFIGDYKGSISCFKIK